MKTVKTILFSLLATCPLFIHSQQFSFQMFFTDAIGNKDTITLGYDPLATYGIDDNFGEENIIDVPLKSTLDVRITDEYFNRTYNDMDGTYHTKKQIIPYDCIQLSFESIQTIDISTKHWPVTAKWNSALFNDSCRDGSLFTSINPGGWWDTGSPSNLYRRELVETDSVTFTSNLTGEFFDDWFGYIKGDDTIPVFWQLISSVELLTSVNELKSTTTEVNIFPNPFADQLTIQAQTNEPSTLYLFDGLGRPVLKQLFFNSATINTSQLAKGIYYYQLSGEHGFIKTGKVIRQ